MTLPSVSIQSAPRLPPETKHFVLDGTRKWGIREVINQFVEANRIIPYDAEAVKQHFFSLDGTDVEAVCIPSRIHYQNGDYKELIQKKAVAGYECGLCSDVVSCPLLLDELK